MGNGKEAPGSKVTGEVSRREVSLGWPPTPLHLDGLTRCGYYLSMCSSLQCHKVLCESKDFFCLFDHYFFSA